MKSYIYPNKLMYEFSIQSHCVQFGRLRWFINFVPIFITTRFPFHPTDPKSTQGTSSRNG